MPSSLIEMVILHSSVKQKTLVLFRNMNEEKYTIFTLIKIFKFFIYILYIKIFKIGFTFNTLGSKERYRLYRVNLAGVLTTA
jgi:hypothetical protein